MSFTLEGPVLEGALVRLEPLEHSHAADLAMAAEEDRDAYRFTWVPAAAEVKEYVDARLARGGDVDRLCRRHTPASASGWCC